MAMAQKNIWAEDLILWKIRYPSKATKLSSQAAIFLSHSICFYFSTAHIFETKSLFKLSFRVKPTKNKAQDRSSLDLTPI